MRGLHVVLWMESGDRKIMEIMIMMMPPYATAVSPHVRTNSMDRDVAFNL